MRRLAPLAMAVVGLSLGGPAMAAGPRAAQLARQWQDLSTDEQNRAIKNYQHYQSLPPNEKKTFQADYERWKKLPPGEKDKLRRKYRDRGRRD
ncbi:MAG: hypothetical protein QOD06_3480 [Candidatus Binatota bacterium]|nr:hypothetical protein [Candidatus Binatota bacterium]